MTIVLFVLCAPLPKPYHFVASIPPLRQWAAFLNARHNNGNVCVVSFRVVYYLLYSGYVNVFFFFVVFLFHCVSLCPTL